MVCQEVLKRVGNRCVQIKQPQLSRRRQQSRLELGSFLSCCSRMEIELAKRRENSGIRKAERTKEEPEVSRSRPLAEMAASRGITETALLADYRSSLRAHGETAEDRLHKEFGVWLVKFAQAVDSNESRTQAWQELKSKCDVLLLLQDLYLFTYPGKIVPDVLKDACRFLKKELDRLIPRYSTLYKHTSDLFTHANLRLLGELSDAVSVLFKEPMHLIATAQRELDVIRMWAEKMGSYKTEAHDFHLYSMATRVRKATGEYHFSELTTLTEAALAAHGAPDEEALDQWTLERRVQRYVTRMNLPRRQAATGKKQ